MGKPLVNSRRRFAEGVSLCSRAMFIAAVCLLAAGVLVVGQMVVIRYVFVGSTVWQTEFVIYSVTAATFLSSPFVLMTGGHVRIGILAEHGGAGWRRFLNSAAAMVSMFFLFVLGWTGYEYFAEAWSEGWLTETAWELPLWIPLLPLPMGMFWTGMQCLAEMLRPADGEAS